VNSADVVFASTQQQAIDSVNKYVYAKSVFFNGENAKINERRQNYIRSINRSRQPFLFSSKNEEWSELLASKLSQSFGFRNAEGFENITEELENLIPTEIEEEVEELKRLVFPSILELLQNGIGFNKSQKSEVISTGFADEYKYTRFEALLYQHRMHPDIAQVSKDNFYNENQSLLPANTVLQDRGWTYQKNQPSLVWLHNNDTTFRKQNSKIINPTEIVDIMGELKKFILWANDYPKYGDDGEIINYEVAILTFYVDQENELRKALRQLTNQHKVFSKFHMGNADIFLYTVDKFQGQEADFTMLGFTKFSGNAHYNSPNRLNVALTRARHKLILFGNKEWFKRHAKLKALRELASNYNSIKKIK
jgi:hypothetical protein